VYRKLTAASIVLAVFALLMPSAGSATPYGLAQLASAGPAGGNGPFQVNVRGVNSGDGSRVAFETTEPLVAEDLDQQLDAYVTDGLTVSIMSTGPLGGNGSEDAWPVGASFDGSRIFFMTREALVPEDSDGLGLDVYGRGSGVTALISQVPPPACSYCNLTFYDASDDGRRVFFGDGMYDIYENFDGVVTLASVGPTGHHGAIVSVEQYRGTSADGTHLFFNSRDNLVAEDQDNCGQPGVQTPCHDFYERTGGQTYLISTGPAGGNGPFDNFYGNSFANSRDGLHAVFASPEQLVPEDTDTSYDLYERTGGQTRLVSTGPSSTGGASSPRLGYPFPFYFTVSEDGSRIFFDTDEQLVPEDHDTFLDVYMRENGTTTLISTGPRDDAAGNATFERATADGEHVVFRSFSRLTAQDTDSLPDVYERLRGKTRLVSIGPAGGNGSCADEQSVFACHPGVVGMTRNGARVFFGTQEALVANDTDHESDIYVRIRGATRLITRGAVGGNGPFHASAVGATAAPDGQVAWFTTAEQLSPEDTDSQLDLYVVRARPPRPCPRVPRSRCND
jgi:hypothetical protein